VIKQQNEESPSAGQFQYPVVSERLSDIQVRTYGDTAILTAINTAQFSDSTIRYRRTTVWVRRQDR
jgi:hypothetical protein